MHSRRIMREDESGPHRQESRAKKRLISDASAAFPVQVRPFFQSGHVTGDLDRR